MARTIQNCLDDVSGFIHGKNVNKVRNVYSAGRRAAQNLLAKIDPDETRQIATITLYDGITDYAAFSDLKEKGVIDVRPQFNTFKDRRLSDNLSNRLSKDFDMKRRWGSWFTVMNNNGLQYFRIKAQLTPSALSFDSLSVLGKWTATAAASNLLLESVIYTQGALQFDMASGANPTSGYIENTAITAQNFTTLVNKSSAFVELYIPTAAALAAIVSIDLRWGNDTTTKYYNRTITTPHLGSLKVGKNILRFDWNGATKTGAIDATKINSARITVNTNGTAISALIVSNLFFSLATIWEIEYYSKFLFQTSAGVWGDTITDTTDTINLDTVSYNLFLYEFALACLQQIQGKDAAADRDYFKKELYGDKSNDEEGLYDLYKKNNPSQREKITQTYYSNFGFRGTGGGRYRRW